MREVGKFVKDMKDTHAAEASVQRREEKDIER